MADSSVTSVLGLARRLPGWHPEKTEWRAVDVSTASTGDLAPHFEGSDAVVHLAWLFQPTRDPVTTWHANVLGSLRVFAAAARAKVPALVYGSSVGAYSPARRTAPSPRTGPPTAGPAPPTGGRRPTWSGRSTPSSGTIRTSGWYGSAPASSSSGRRRPSSGGCSAGRSCRSG
nr:hypothetical protein GCM10020093_005510 [Planobispora longispora]